MQQVEEKTMNGEICQKLVEPFPSGVIRKKSIERNGKEVILDYIPGNHVIERLNEAFQGNWTFKVIDKIIDKESLQIAVLGQLAVEDSGKTITKEQWGASHITLNRYGNFLSLGDDLKVATTDSLKKCATLLGVGLYLYDEVYVQDTVEEVQPPVSQEQAEQIRSAIKQDEEIEINPKEQSITPQQVQAIKRLLERYKYTEQQLLEFVGKKELSELTYEEAGQIITLRHKFWLQ
ncbi:MAG: Rad52/Rad22 family DNA repair protein [Candidatus Njordarchaeia archaeon]